VFGPDLHYVDTLDYSVDPAEAPAFAAYIRKFWPGLPNGALAPDYAGIRPKLHGPDEPQPDFRLDGKDAHGLPNLVTLFGIESPGPHLILGDRRRSGLAPQSLTLIVTPDFLPRSSPRSWDPSRVWGLRQRSTVHRAVWVAAFAGMSGLGGVRPICGTALRASP